MNQHNYITFLRLVIHAIQHAPKSQFGSVFICVVLHDSPALAKPEFKAFRNRLRKSIHIKLFRANQKYKPSIVYGTLTPIIGYGLEPRVAWLESLIKYRTSRGEH